VNQQTETLLVWFSHIGEVLLVMLEAPDSSMSQMYIPNDSSSFVNFGQEKGDWVEGLKALEETLGDSPQTRYEA